jgi:hypothetical protein
MRALGWLGHDHDSARRLHSSHAVELMVVERAFSIQLAGGPLSARPASADAAGRAATLVQRELSRYPPAFFQRVRLSRVLLCRDLRENGQPIPSLPNYHRTLLLDVDASPGFLSRLIHHELFHFIDYAGDDKVGADPAWEALNNRWFVYGSGGRFMRDRQSSEFGSGPAGFVSRYATSGTEEDKAEVFAFMVVSRGQMQALAHKDRVLAAKMSRIEADLAALGLALPAQL